MIAPSLKPQARRWGTKLQNTYKAPVVDVKGVKMVVKTTPPQKSNTKYTCRGNTDRINGNVFQAPSEQHDIMHFQRNVEALDAYVRKNMTYYTDVAPLSPANCKNPTITLPTMGPYSAGELVHIIFQEEVKDHVKPYCIILNNLAAVYAILGG
jgi:hypothetical protein